MHRVSHLASGSESPCSSPRIATMSPDPTAWQPSRVTHVASLGMPDHILELVCCHVMFRNVSDVFIRPKEFEVRHRRSLRLNHHPSIPYSRRRHKTTLPRLPLLGSERETLAIRGVREIRAFNAPRRHKCTAPHSPPQRRRVGCAAARSGFRSSNFTWISALSRATPGASSSISRADAAAWSCGAGGRETK
jgi:hypothetical protein